MYTSALDRKQDSASIITGEKKRISVNQYGMDSDLRPLSSL